MRTIFIAACTAVAFATPLFGQTEDRPTDTLLDLIGVPETVDIMRAEGLAYARELAEEMLPAAPGQGWERAIDEIYDAARMEETVRAGFYQSFGDNDMNTDTLERFFGSEMGQDIIRLELSAREAMSDEAIEDAAKEAFLERAEASDTDDERLELLRAFVETNDLIEANVVGGLNTTIRFYQGLVDGQALQLSDEEILIEVRETEEATRQDTTEWVFGFLFMAYRPLTDAQLSDYAELAASPEGRAMNTGLFTGFNKMYSDISYALGRAIASQMTVTEL